MFSIMEDLIKFTGEKIQESIDEFTRRRTRIFTVVRWFKYPIVALTAIYTIVLGLQLNEIWILIQMNIALEIGAIVTACNTLMTFWNIEEYWIKYKEIELQLKSLKK